MSFEVVSASELFQINLLK